MSKAIEQIWIGKTSTCLRVTKLATKIWTQFADHHPASRLLEAPYLATLQKIGAMWLVMSCSRREGRMRTGPSMWSARARRRRTLHPTDRNRYRNPAGIDDYMVSRKNADTALGQNVRKKPLM